MTRIAEVLQQAVAGQFLAAQQGQRVERSQLGVELIALVGIDGFATVLAGFEYVVDLLGAGLAAADLRLGTLGAGLRVDDQAVGFRQRLLQLALQRVAFAEHLFKLWHGEVGVALCHRLCLGFLEPGQLLLAVAGLLGGTAQLLLECSQFLFVVFLGSKQAQRLFEHLLQRLLVCLGQLALGDLVEAVLDTGGGRGFCRASGKRKGQAQPEQGCAKVHAQGHRQTTCGSGRNEV
ncbi:hypothetical protein D9M71_379810 [compost metagenome]